MFFCWGLGRLTASGVLSNPDFGPALAALIESRTTVFSLDLVQADWHSLSGHLEALALETGGFYERTYALPARGIEHVREALSGYYLVSLEAPSPGRRPTLHEVEIRLVHRPGTVYARRWCVR